MHGRTLRVGALLVVSACAASPSPPLLGPGPEAEPPLNVLGRPSAAAARARDQVLGAAKGFVEGGELRAGGLTFDRDPVGFVRAAFWAAEVELLDPNLAAEGKLVGLPLLFQSLARAQRLHSETPRPADLAFFDPEPGQRALEPTQVAIVEAVSPGGKITLVGWFAEGPGRISMNLRDGAAAADNSSLSGEAAAELFRVFADPWR